VKHFGTESRREVEFKYAFRFPSQRPPPAKTVLNIIGKSIQDALASEEMRFDKQNFSSYTFSPDFQAFAFKDIYFDTHHFRLQRANAAYRLRYRWTSFEKYVHHTLLPALARFYPDRCEIQFKADYERRPSDNTISATESRFEFRNE